MKYSVFKFLGICFAFICCMACGDETDNAALSREVHFEIALNALSRAPQDVDFNQYSVKVYVFKQEGPGDYVAVKEQEVMASSFTIDGLMPKTAYRYVFLAIPRTQTPALPAVVAGMPYAGVTMSYVTGNQTGNEVFRNILTCPSDDEVTSYPIVLTRQNGAIEVRLNNADGAIKTVTLEAKGFSDMYFDDGENGKVFSSGEEITFSSTKEPGLTADFRIRINLLPMEDLTGKGKLTLTYTDGSVKEYPLTSTSGGIPIYPNQVTWLVLSGTGGGGGFDVHFGENIDLDDDLWDGVQ